MAAEANRSVHDPHDLKQNAVVQRKGEGGARLAFAVSTVRDGLAHMFRQAA